jgi:5-methylcytosine-specific restriction endonuclease McrA
VSAIQVIVCITEPHPQSRAALILLHRYYVDELNAKRYWQIWLDKRNEIVSKLIAAKIPMVCTYCGKSDLIPFGDISYSKKIVTIDHIKPRCLGGSNELSNIALSCHKCNSRKGSSLPDKKYLNRIVTIGQLLCGIQAAAK